MQNKSDPYSHGVTQLLLMYVDYYQKDARMFLGCFTKFKSVRSVSESIVAECEKSGVLKEARETGKDFSEYAGKQDLDEKWKRVLSELLLIIYAIIKK